MIPKQEAAIKQSKPNFPKNDNFLPPDTHKTNMPNTHFTKVALNTSGMLWLWSQKMSSTRDFPQFFSEFTFKKYIFLSLGVMTQVSIWKFYRQLTLLKKQKQCSTRTYITVIIKNHVCVNDNTILLCRCCFCLLIKIVWVSSALIILDVAFSQNNFTKTTIPV